jgi:Xaa-Pro dipeptidase
MFSPVLLAASEERMGFYRHPIPRGGALGRRAMLVVCAERGGLYANLTRMIDFEVPDVETGRRQRACDPILQRMRVGPPVPAAPSSMPSPTDGASTPKRASRTAGGTYHQDGMTSYALREIVATPETRQVIMADQVFA